MPLKGAKKRRYNKQYLRPTRTRYPRKKWWRIKRNWRKAVQTRPLVVRPITTKTLIVGIKSTVRSKLHYAKDIEKSRADSATRSKASYDNDPDSGIKSTVRSKLHYDKDIEKSRADSATRSKASYDKDPDSGLKSTVRSKLQYDKDIKKNRADSATRSKATYEKDPESGQNLQKKPKLIIINMPSKQC